MSRRRGGGPQEEAVFGFKRRRRQRLRTKGLSASEVATIERNVPVYRRLSSADQRELQGHVRVFLDEKRFEGGGGLEITDEIRVTIAAQACLLLLHRDTDYYPALRTILVYPHAYIVQASERLPGGIVVEGRQVRLGESWGRGLLVLAWDAVLRTASDVHDGHNVVLHEFAHQLDAESGSTEGAPILPRRSMYVAWARVLEAEYDDLLDDVTHHRDTVLDGYGATSPAEFFAVATESFFETPGRLKARHPELYEQLRLFYQQDPAAFERPDPSPPTDQ